MEEDILSSHAQNNGSGQAVSVTTIISDRTAKWVVLAIVAALGAYAVAHSQSAYDMAQHDDMNYTLVYSHLVREDAWLQAHGVNTKNFGPIPKTRSVSQ